MLSILQLADHLERAAIRAKNELEIPTDALMVKLEAQAKGYIGEYQDGWAPLAESTLQGWTSPDGRHFPGKIELGYAPPDNPLLRTGDMRETIEHYAIGTVGGATGEIGSNDMIAYWQEFGTSRGIPPRPFIGLSMYHSQEPATVIFGEFALALLR